MVRLRQRRTERGDGKPGGNRQEGIVGVTQGTQAACWSLVGERQSLLQDIAPLTHLMQPPSACGVALHQALDELHPRLWAALPHPLRPLHAALSLRVGEEQL
jgi:hypothetical protein